MIEALPTIAVLGGTGKEGKGLALRWAKAGYPVVIGSRLAEKAQAACQELLELCGGGVALSGATNPSAAEQAQILVLTVPYAAHRETLSTIKPFAQGKLLVDVTVPLVPPKVTQVQMPPAGSAAQEARQVLGDGVDVVDAFQNISHEHLITDEPVDCDVLVCGTSKAARAQALLLVKAAGLVGWDAGPIENAVVIEGLTSILIHLNKQYGVKSSGIRITGIELS
jgi:hypothetical protein